jgi:Ion channel
VKLKFCLNFRIFCNGTRFYTDRYGVYSFDFYFKGSGITKKKEDFENQPQKVSFRDALYFSVNTFTTVGNANWYPKENFKKWATLEGLLGWTMLGIFMATLTNMIMRL